ncbi:hypothetical protein Tco_1087069, partial [Tanacetum coccineum]
MLRRLNQLMERKECGGYGYSRKGTKKASKTKHGMERTKSKV